MREHGVGFRIVKAALESVWPEPRKKPRPRGTRLDAYKPLIDQMLRASSVTPSSGSSIGSWTSTGRRR
ncbi:hypothetical protein GCM10010309_80720 [Streptomyces violaceochromogenes]|nr:hypothetical protein GCM10010309_80720 [Streptomyces violaceochromogenes]